MSIATAAQQGATASAVPAVETGFTAGRGNQPLIYGRGVDLSDIGLIEQVQGEPRSFGIDVRYKY